MTDEEIAAAEERLEELREDVREDLAEDLGGEPEDYDATVQAATDGGDT